MLNEEETRGSRAGDAFPSNGGGGLIVLGLNPPKEESEEEIGETGLGFLH